MQRIIQYTIHLKSKPWHLNDYCKIRQYQWEYTVEKVLLDIPCKTSVNNCLYNCNKLLYLNWKMYNIQKLLIIISYLEQKYIINIEYN